MKKNSDLLNDMATTWDFENPIQFVVPAEDRDFSRPREPFNINRLPVDFAQAADDSQKPSPLVKQVQQYLSSHPLGVAYSGGINGIYSPEVSIALMNLQGLAAQKLPNAPYVALFDDKGPKADGLNKLVTLIKENKSNSGSTSDQNQTISDFEKMFNLQVTGKISQNLISKIEEIESQISKKLGESASGKILDKANNSFLTSPSDVQKALSLLDKSQTKSSSKNDRFDALLKISNIF